MNFDKLPNEIKQMIFDKNREVMENVRKRNFEMVQVEMKMLFQDEEYPWCEVKPSILKKGGWLWKDKDAEDQLEMYYYFTNREILPVDKFVRKYMTGIHPSPYILDDEEIDEETTTILQEIEKWDRDKELNNQVHQRRWPPGLLCKDRGSNDHIFCGHSEYESNCKCWFHD